MSIIQDAITSLWGDTSDDWQGAVTAQYSEVCHLQLLLRKEPRPTPRYMNIPTVIQPWIEISGGNNTAICCSRFLDPEQPVYGGGDAITQRQSLIEACEQKVAVRLSIRHWAN